MKQLPNTWITDGIIDFEYKKYVLLAYLKQVKSHFEKGKLYPQLGDLVMHFNNLIRLKENKSLLFDNFPKRISKVNLRKLKFTYEQIIEDDELMEEIETIVNYALPEFQDHINQGKELYDLVEENLVFEPVGVVPIYDQEGYIFLSEDNRSPVYVYLYKATIFERSDEKYRSLQTVYLTQETQSLARSARAIKLDLIKQFQNLPNPATFLFTTKLSFPIRETILPVVKRRLIRELKFAA